ncbi:hypothetical protein [Limosilactobacillus gastricus]|uniref:hypothetical protein n=1 Tax=Limosilactobacillus gastricus TaxID=227942 RepID=UPI0026F2B1C1|nr:hypothetical protein [Limosilactobacillus gastricus]
MNWVKKHWLFLLIQVALVALVSLISDPEIKEVIDVLLAGYWLVFIANSTHLNIWEK